MVANPRTSCDQCHLTERDPRLQVLLILISTTFRKPVCVCELARVADLEPCEVSRLFKDKIGHGPKRLQAIFRIGYTLSELISADRQIKDIAADAGLPVVETFIRNCEKLCGLPPDEFRRLVEEIEGGEAEIAPRQARAAANGVVNG